MKANYRKLVQFCADNKFSINLAKNPIVRGRSKHIETKFHFLRDKLNKDKLSLKYCNTKLKVVDVFTKPLQT